MQIYFAGKLRKINVFQNVFWSIKLGVFKLSFWMKILKGLQIITASLFSLKKSVAFWKIMTFAKILVEYSCKLSENTRGID